MFATTYPGAKCCILRENLDAVKQSFLDKLPTLFPQEVNGIKLYEYREKSTSWYPSRSIVFPNGSYITLQRVADYKEAKQKQGWEFNYLAVDEVTKQQEETIDYLLTCVRSVETVNKYTGQTYRIPTKVVFGCNPGGPGHKWVKRRYIDTTVKEYDKVTNAPLLTKDFVETVQHPYKKEVKIKRYIRFIPASWRDNPFLADAYVANLMQQPEHMRKMDLDGNWDVVAGRMFEFADDQKIDYYIAQNALSKEFVPFEIYVSVDWGYKPSYHSAIWHAVFQNGRVISFKEMYGQELVFEDFAKELLRRCEGLHISGLLLPHDMFRHGERYRDETGKYIGETKSEVFENLGLPTIGVESGKGKVQMRFDKIQSATKLKESDGQSKFQITKNCEHLWEELEQAVYDEFDPTRIAKACKDHAIDAYGLFLVFYSSDISPIGFEDAIVDMRSRLQVLLDEEEEYLDSLDDDAYCSVEDTWEF